MSAPRAIVELALDCADPAALSRFWTAALGYVDHTPDGNDNEFAWLGDPEEKGPHLALIRVPEPKASKNRLHLDLMVSQSASPEEGRDRVIAETRRLRDLGATVLAEYEGDHITMADPEGNEFDVC